MIYILEPGGPALPKIQALRTPEDDPAENS